MTLDKVGGGSDAPADGMTGHAAVRPHRQPKKLIFAPGDIAAPTTTSTTTNTTSTDPTIPTPMPMPMPTPIPSRLLPTTTPSTNDGTPTPLRSTTSTPITNATLTSHPSRAHQFLTNPPLTISQITPTNPFRQFNTWFRDARLPASSAPETCTLATASLPSGRVSARTLYLKELDERGWVVYSNWGSRRGKGGQVFGDQGEEEIGEGWRDGVSEGDGGGEVVGKGNRWAALTFHWQAVERQVRVEGVIESLSREESEMYWRTRERGSQIGAWASRQSKVLWEMGEPPSAPAPAPTHGGAVVNGVSAAAGTIVGEGEEDVDDGRSILEARVKEMEARFADTAEIPLPPFWGGIRIVPESVEFWQGRKSRLHDRFRYVRVHGGGETGEETAKEFRWRVQRLSP
ncbi:hypothetical protein FQN50_005946 [Emmonsiellopsis sp. PD_5]|nr:hypothetical protein FQN50_005946 [Emmonsiellopsis sp. PD_5]